MDIRYALETDFAELNAFYIRMNEVINLRTDNFNPDNPVFPSEEMIKDAIRTNGQFVGVEDGKIVAACIVNHECEPAYLSVKWQVEASKEEFWVLHALRVLPEYEGRGFAKQMLRHLIAVAPERGQKAIRLDVLEGYAVERMYAHQGFEFVDTIEILYEDIGYPRRFRLLELVV